MRATYEYKTEGLLMTVVGDTFFVNGFALPDDESNKLAAALDPEAFAATREEGRREERERVARFAQGLRRLVEADTSRTAAHARGRLAALALVLEQLGPAATPSPEGAEPAPAERCESRSKAGDRCDLPVGHAGGHEARRSDGASSSTSGWPGTPAAAPHGVEPAKLLHRFIDRSMCEPQDDEACTLAREAVRSLAALPPSAPHGGPAGGPKRPQYEPKTAEQRLGYLIEECGEVLAAAGKSVRWGLASYNPELPEDEQETNEQWLHRELLDLVAAIRRVEPLVGEVLGTVEQIDQLRRERDGWRARADELAAPPPQGEAGAIADDIERMVHAFPDDGRRAAVRALASRIRAIGAPQGEAAGAPSVARCCVCEENFEPGDAVRVDTDGSLLHDCDCEHPKVFTRDLPGDDHEPASPHQGSAEAGKWHAADSPEGKILLRTEAFLRGDIGTEYPPEWDEPDDTARPSMSVVSPEGSDEGSGTAEPPPMTDEQRAHSYRAAWGDMGAPVEPTPTPPGGPSEPVSRRCTTSCGWSWVGTADEPCPHCDEPRPAPGGPST
jgi:hypothetical protein